MKQPAKLLDERHRNAFGLSAVDRALELIEVRREPAELDPLVRRDRVGLVTASAIALPLCANERAVVMLSNCMSI